MAAFDYLNNQTGGEGGAPTSPASTTESTNAQQRTQVLGKIADTLDAGNTDQAALLTDIAAAITSDIIGGTTGTTANRVLVAKGTTGRALQPTPVTINPSTGDTDFNGADIIDVDAFAANSGAFANTLTKGGAALALASQTIGASFTFAFPENGTVYLILNAQFAWTITSTSVITNVGSATVTGFILGVTSLSANSATTSVSSVAQSASVSAGNHIGVTFSSTSSDCESLCFTIWGTRVFAS